MNELRKDIRDLIAINEKIQSALAQGDRFTEDETAIIRMCAGELLEKTEGLYVSDDGDGAANRVRSAPAGNDIRMGAN